MNRFQLFLETSDPELFRKSTSELGTTFYRILSGDGVKEPFTYEIVYFSGSRIAKFVGTPTPELLKFCQANAYKVETIIIDEIAGAVKIIQKEGL